MRIGRTRAPSLARVVVCLAFAATTAIADDAHRHDGDLLRYAIEAVLVVGVIVTGRILCRKRC